MGTISEFNMDIFRTRLRELRVQHEPPLTQGELGEAINISRGSISFYENGDRMPDISVLKKMAEFFGVSSDYLLGIEDATDKSREMEIHVPLPGREAPILSKDAVSYLVQEALRSVGTLAVLKEPDQSKFVTLFNKMNIMVNFALSVGPADNLMGQRTAIYRFIEASTELQKLVAELTQQAYNKYCELSPEGKPGIQMRVRSVSRDKKESLRDGVVEK